MPTMYDFKIFLVFAFVHYLSWPCLSQQVREKIICPWRDYVDCRSLGLRNPSIHVVDVIYGRVVGLNECGFKPTVNCTAPAYCEVAEKSDRRNAGKWLKPNELKPDPCPGENKYLIVKYRCLDWRDTPLVGENFALKKPTFQSQTTSGGTPSRAVDGNTASNFFKHSCTHTKQETTPWWRVDLEQRIVVSHVRIFNRDNAGVRLCGFQIRIGDSIKNNGTTNARCGTLRHIPTNKDDVISCEPPLVGRYVTIVIPGEDKILVLCEVEVYGTGVLGQRNLTGAHLIGSNLPYEGHVVLDGSTFCNPTWSPRDQHTTCLQLGYPRASTGIPSGSFFDQSESGARPVVKKFNCSSAESSLNECAQTDSSGETCLSENTVKVRCQPYLRLGGSNIPLEGRVEVLHEGAWGTVCVYSPRNWKEDARVTCRELGFYDAVGYFRSEPKFNRAVVKSWLKDVNCRGDEKSLVFCKHNNWENTSCDHDNDIAVRCSICAEPLLTNKTRFPNSIFNASASRSSDYSPSSGRPYSASSWCLPDTHLDQNQFLEINLPAIYSLSAVATVGGSIGYVTSYELSYMVNDNQWLYATVNNKQIISGNTNNDTHNVIRRELDQPCHVQRIKFIPKTWIDIPCMRVELCGKELPRCHPSTITITEITSTSALVTWAALLIPDTGKQHNNYSVTLSKAKSYYTKTTSRLIDHLFPYRQYNVSVIAVGLQECYDMHVPPTSFLTAEAAPSGSPVNVQFREVDDIGSITLSVTWSAPDIEKRNGKITNYSLCYSTATLTADCNSGTIVNTTATSIIIKGLEAVTIYFFRIRAYTKVGPGPYTNAINITTSLEPLSAPFYQTAKALLFSFKKPKKDVSFYEVIAVSIPNNSTPTRSPDTYRPEDLTHYNEVKDNSQSTPYIAATFMVNQNEFCQIFILGDEVKYSKLYGSAGVDSYFNGPLKQNSTYRVFLRFFKHENNFYSSNWSPPARTNSLEPVCMQVTTKSESSNKGCSKTVIYAVISISLVINAVLVVVVTYVCLRPPKRQPCVKDSVVIVENVTFSDGTYDEVQNPDPDSNHENINSSAYEALDLNKKDQDQNTYQSLVKPTV